MNKMTRYEFYQNKAQECENKARNTKDTHLKQFFINCANGFYIKANNLTIEQAEGKYEI